MDTAPRNGEEIIILFNTAGVDVVRSCWWSDGEWWSYRNSVTQETIEHEAVGWIDMTDYDENHTP